MRLNEMITLEDGWDSYGAASPNEISITSANRIIESLTVEPSSLRPSAEGGIMIRYGDGSRGVFVECYNDGEIGYSLIENKQPTMSVDMLGGGINPLDFIASIRKHLEGPTRRRTAV